MTDDGVNHDGVRARLRNALTAAMEDRDAIATGAYRTATAAIDDAEAVRGRLDEADQRAIVAEQAVSRRRAADDHAGDGNQAAALRLWAEADLLQALLT